MKYLRPLFCVLLVAAAFSSARAGDDDRVTGQIRGFYKWYFHLINTSPGDSEIKGHRRDFSRYVTANFLHHIEHMSEGEGQEGDPFFLQPDWDPLWEKNIEVDHIKIGRKGEATAVVSFKGKDYPLQQLRLTLMLEDGVYKIAKVEHYPTGDTTEPSPTPAPSATP